MADHVSLTESAMAKPKADLLVPGEWYHIVMDDCCVEGALIGQFICFWNEIETLTDDGFEYETLLSIEAEEEYWEALFSFGLLGPSWGAWYPVRLKTRGI